MEKELSKEAENKSLVKRDDNGRFVKGYSGNPAGKPKGIKHRSTLIKQTIDAAMADMLHEDFIEVMEVAIRKAKQGDNAMIKLLLGEFLAEVRKSQDDGKRGDQYTQIIIENYTLPDVQEKTIHEHGSIEGQAEPTGEYTGEG